MSFFWTFSTAFFAGNLSKDRAEFTLEVTELQAGMGMGSEERMKSSRIFDNAISSPVFLLLILQ
jgi:hypothetical protein